MSSEYPEELKEEAKRKLIEQFDNLSKIGYGEIKIQFNKDKGNILIIPSPYLRIENLTKKNNEV